MPSRSQPVFACARPVLVARDLGSAYVRLREALGLGEPFEIRTLLGVAPISGAGLFEPRRFSHLLFVVSLGARLRTRDPG